MQSSEGEAGGRALDRGSLPTGNPASPAGQSTAPRPFQQGTPPHLQGKVLHRAPPNREPRLTCRAKYCTAPFPTGNPASRGMLTVIGPGAHSAPKSMEGGGIIHTIQGGGVISYIKLPLHYYPTPKFLGNFSPDNGRDSAPIPLSKVSPAYWFPHIMQSSLHTFGAMPPPLHQLIASHRAWQWCTRPPLRGGSCRWSPEWGVARSKRTRPCDAPGMS